MAIPSNSPENRHGFSWAFPVQNWKNKTKSHKMRIICREKLRTRGSTIVFHIIVRAYTRVCVPWKEIWSFLSIFQSIIRHKTDENAQNPNFYRRILWNAQKEPCQTCHILCNLRIVKARKTWYIVATARDTSPTGGGRHSINRISSGHGQYGGTLKTEIVCRRYLWKMPSVQSKANKPPRRDMRRAKRAS